MKPNFLIHILVLFVSASASVFPDAEPDLGLFREALETETVRQAMTQLESLTEFYGFGSSLHIVCALERYVKHGIEVDGVKLQKRIEGTPIFPYIILEFTHRGYTGKFMMNMGDQHHLTIGYGYEAERTLLSIECDTLVSEVTVFIDP